MPKFQTKQGWLTPYALHCGYIEQRIIGSVSVTLWHEGGPYYQVRAHNHETGVRYFWESSETLKEARKIYSQGIKAAKDNKLIQA